MHGSAQQSVNSLSHMVFACTYAGLTLPQLRSLSIQKLLGSLNLASVNEPFCSEPNASAIAKNTIDQSDSDVGHYFVLYFTVIT